MALKIVPGSEDKKTSYEMLLKQLDALVEGEKDQVANLSNIMAALKEVMGYFWVGCYFVKEDELVLGPFQGPVACTRIGFGNGVCGTAWKQKETIIVDDVDKFPGHIACSAQSKSEIVVPVFNDEGEVALILDVDSNKTGAFDETDKIYLKKVASLIEEVLK